MPVGGKRSRNSHAWEVITPLAIGSERRERGTEEELKLQ